MFRDEIGGKTRGLRIHPVRFGLRKSGRIGLAFGRPLGRAQVNFREEGGAHVVLHIGSIDDAHVGSIRSVAQPNEWSQHEHHQ